MKLYNVEIIADKYPKSYTVSASGWSTAASRAIKQWKKDFKGNRSDHMTVRMIKSSDLLKEEKHE